MCSCAHVCMHGLTIRGDKQTREKKPEDWNVRAQSNRLLKTIKLRSMLHERGIV